MTASAFEAWMTNLRQAWLEHDPDAAAALFSADVRYAENPFDPPLRGRAAVRNYWQEMLAGQREVSFEFEVLAVTGRRALVNWRVAYRDAASGERASVDGVSAGRFRAGLCHEWREWWHKRSG